MDGDIFVEALARLSDCGLAAPIETFLAGREESKLATSWLSYKQTVLLGTDGLPKLAPLDNVNIMARLWTGISPPWLSTKRADEVHPPRHVGLTERAAMQLEELSDTVLDAFLRSRTEADPPSQRLKDLAGPFSELICLLLSVTTLCSFDGDARNGLSERALRLASVMVKSLCIAAQSARQTPEMPVLLITCFRLNEFFARVGTVFVKAPSVNDVHLSQASIGRFEDLGHSSDLTSWTTTLVKSLSQSLGPQNVHYLMEDQRIPLWNLAMSLLSHSDGMIRTHIQSTVLHLLQVSPPEMIDVMRDGDFRVNARLDAAIASALRCATINLDRVVISIRLQRASSCSCWSLRDPQSIWRPGHLCKSCQQLLMACVAATGDLEDICLFLEEVLEQPLFAEESHRVTMLSRIMQDVVLTFWIRAITPSLTTLLNYRRVICSGLASTGERRRARKPTAEKSSALSHLTVRLCLEVMRKKLSESHPALVGLTWLAISAPAIPAPLMALLIGKPFFKAMRDLPKEKSQTAEDIGCCCCAAASLWPVPKWWSGGETACGFARKILDDIARTVRQGLVELHGEGHECLLHHRHLVTNTPRSCKVSRWSRRLSNPGRKSSASWSSDLAFPFETASLLALIDLPSKDNACLPSAETKIFSTSLLKALKLTALSDSGTADVLAHEGFHEHKESVTLSVERIGESDNDGAESVESSESYMMGVAPENFEDRVVMRLPVDVTDGEEPTRNDIETKMLEVYGKHLHCVSVEAFAKETGEISIAFNREDADDCEYYWEIWSSLFHFQNMSGLEMQLVTSIIRQIPAAIELVEMARKKMHQIMCLAWDSLQDTPLRSDGGTETINSVVRTTAECGAAWSLHLLKEEYDSAEVSSLKSHLVHLGFVARILQDLREYAAETADPTLSDPTSIGVLFVLDDLACRHRRQAGHVVEGHIRGIVTLMTCLDLIAQDDKPGLISRVRAVLGEESEEAEKSRSNVYVTSRIEDQKLDFLEGAIFPCKFVLRHPRSETRDCYFLVGEDFLAVGDVSDVAVSAFALHQRIAWDRISLCMSGNRAIGVADTNGRELFALICPDAAVFRTALHQMLKRQGEVISRLWDEVASH